jgi:tetratricopeptide (TPR) repeat protein
LARIHHLRGNLYFSLGNFDGCLKEHELALAFARQVQSPEWEARALAGLADAYYIRGHMRTAHDHIRRSLDLCRRHGLGRIEVENLSMAVGTGFHLHDPKRALADCLAAAKAAHQVGHQRAEMIARVIAGCTHLNLGEQALAKEQLKLALALARLPGARNYEALSLSVLGRIALDEGDHRRAMELAEEALEICRESGTSLFKATALGVLALITDDAETKKQALQEGESELREGGVSFDCHLFYQIALESWLRSRDWERAERYATALEEYSRPERSPFADFLIARARALAAAGRGLRNEALTRELKALRDQAMQIGWKLELPALEEALSAD